MLCEPSPCGTETAIFPFQSPSPVHSLSVLDLLEVQPWCSAKLNLSTPPCRSLPHFYLLEKCLKYFYSGVHMRVYRRTACCGIPNIPVSLPYVCSNTDFPPLGTSWEHTNTCVCQLPGIQGPILSGLLLAVLSHFSRCPQSCEAVRRRTLVFSISCSSRSGWRGKSLCPRGGSADLLPWLTTGLE